MTLMPSPKPKTPLRIVVLTGAGVSAESGLGTFRDAGGIWSQYDLEDVATPEGFARNPALVHDFYNARRANCVSASPNAAHQALAALQDGPHDLMLVTQNIDDLHSRAGSRDVVHMHGQLMQAKCAACGATWPAPDVMDWQAPCPDCAAPLTRPDVVWFGEVPYHMDRIMAAVQSADIFAAIGTSGTVYPAAGFAALAHDSGARTVEINPKPSRSPWFQTVIAEGSETALPRLVDAWLSGS